MATPTEMFDNIAASLPGTVKGKMFGALCIKAANGKAGVMLWKDYMIFKLPETEQERALQLKDARVFSPMDGRPMNGWIQLSAEHAKSWQKLAGIAMEFVSLIEVKAKKITSSHRHV